MKRGLTYGILFLVFLVLAVMNFWINQSMKSMSGASSGQATDKQIDSSVARAVEEGEKKIGADKSKEAGHEGHSHEGPEASMPAQGGIKLGSPNAKVKVQAFVVTSAECHQKTVDLLKKVAQSDPDRVYVEIYELHSPAASQVMASKGVTCATVFVNDRDKYTINRGGQKVEIEMTKKPNDPGSSYNSEDVPLVIDQQLKAIYGKGLKSIPKG